MYVFFTAPENGDATVTLSHKSTDGAHTYFDDVRIVENQYSGITYEKDGTLKSLTNGFENNAQGIWPFVVSGSEGVEDNRIHLSELHAPFTQAGWDVKKMDDVLDGTWSVKVNGLTQKGTLVYQTIPQNVKFEAGAKYKVSFDYQSGSDDIYAIAVGQGEYSAGSVKLTKELGLSLVNSDKEFVKWTGASDKEATDVTVEYDKITDGYFLKLFVNTKKAEEPAKYITLKISDDKGNAIAREFQVEPVNGKSSVIDDILSYRWMGNWKDSYEFVTAKSDDKGNNLSLSTTINAGDSLTVTLKAKSGSTPEGDTVRPAAAALTARRFPTLRARPITRPATPSRAGRLTTRVTSTPALRLPSSSSRAT